MAKGKGSKGASGAPEAASASGGIRSKLVLLMGAMGGAYFAFFAPSGDSAATDPSASSSTTAGVEVTVEAPVSTTLAPDPGATSVPEPVVTTLPGDPEAPAVPWSAERAACVELIDPPAADVTRLVAESPVWLYSVGRAMVINDGAQLVAEVAPGNFAVIDGEDHELTQVLVRPTTAHRVGDVPGAFELRFVHAGPDGSIASIGLVATIGDEPAPIVDELLKARPRPGMPPLPRSLDLYGTVPVEGGLGHDVVAGVPGCPELARRGLLTAGLVVSQDQADALAAIFAPAG